jgi:hypothetical protein
VQAIIHGSNYWILPAYPPRRIKKFLPLLLLLTKSPFPENLAQYAQLHRRVSGAAGCGEGWQAGVYSGDAAGAEDRKSRIKPIALALL